MRLIWFIIIILLALIESWLLPWSAIFGIPIPLVLIFIAVFQAKIDHKVLPWLGLTAGMVIDLNSVSYFGTNSLYYLVVSWLVTLPLNNVALRGRVWVRAGMVIIAAFTQPWYLILVNRQSELDFGQTLAISSLRAGYIGVVSLGSILIVNRKQSMNL